MNGNMKEKYESYEVRAFFLVRVRNMRRSERQVRGTYTGKTRNAQYCSRLKSIKFPDFLDRFPGGLVSNIPIFCTG